MENRVVIIVPIYKEELDEFEEIALRQLYLILCKYKITFVVPQKLVLKREYFSGYSYSIERFEDSYFDSVKSYSSLCLSAKFYERFIKYDYMLIYQLDAFVFSDRINEFIDMGYDYIGAPLAGTYWEEFHVGNGGLSLRNIKKTLRVVRQYNYIVKDYQYKDHTMEFEDLFFGYCGYRNDIDYNVPPICIAAEFALQDDSCDVFVCMVNKGLPFGVHRWLAEDYVFWKPIIEGFGYTLPSIDRVDTLGSMEKRRKDRIYNYLFYWWESEEKEKKDEFLQMCISFKQCIIWGTGYYGKRCLKLLRNLNVSVMAFVDNDKNKSGKKIEGVPVFMPEDKILIDYRFIVVAVEKGLVDINKQLKSILGEKRRMIEVISYFDLLKDIEDFLRVEKEIEGVTIPYRIDPNALVKSVNNVTDNKRG